MIVAGFGFRGSVTPAALADAMAARRPHALATLSDKADHPAFVQFAKDQALPILRIELVDVQQQKTLTQSTKSIALKGTGSVSEACALAAFEGAATLLGPRHVSHDKAATCAFAQGDPK